MQAGRGTTLPKKLYMVVARHDGRVYYRSEGILRKAAVDLMSTWKHTFHLYSVTLEGPFSLAKINPKPGKPLTPGGPFMKVKHT